MGTEMMKCGHSAQGTIAATGEPVCVICVGTTPDAKVIDTDPPATEGRTARCSYAWRTADKDTHRGGGQYAAQVFGSTKPSDPGLPFFKAQPDKAEDSFYCGCWGWD